MKIDDIQVNIECPGMDISRKAFSNMITKALKENDLDFKEVRFYYNGNKGECAPDWIEKNE